MTMLDDAKEILKAFGFDPGRTNDRAARTLLALTGLNQQSKWTNATSPRLGVRAILDWLRSELDFEVAENTRETYRRQTLHQFVEAGFVIQNGDDPNRPTNSSKNNYQINQAAVEVIQAFGTPNFDRLIVEYMSKRQGLADKYRAEKTHARIPVTFPDGKKIDLSPGGQNVLLKSMLEEFGPRFAPSAEVLYVGDADSKFLYFQRESLSQLGVVVDVHGKLPDLVLFSREKNWLFLMEAASSHGPVDNKRFSELQTIFGESSAGLVYVSCFPDRATMRKFLSDLAWDTEAWCSSDPSHMIHLNGDRFLGPRS
jgi:type II restriction enzyme